MALAGLVTEAVLDVLHVEADVGGCG